MSKEQHGLRVNLGRTSRKFNRSQLEQCRKLLTKTKRKINDKGTKILRAEGKSSRKAPKKLMTKDPL